MRAGALAPQTEQRLSGFDRIARIEKRIQALRVGDERRDSLLDSLELPRRGASRETSHGLPQLRSESPDPSRIRECPVAIDFDRYFDVIEIDAGQLEQFPIDQSDHQIMRGSSAPRSCHDEHLPANAGDCQPPDSLLAHDRTLIHTRRSKWQGAATHLAFRPDGEPALLELLERHPDTVIA